MNRIVFWVVTAVAVTSLILGTQAAGGLAGTISGTAGSTGGILVRQIPTFVTSFQTGIHTGGPIAPKGGGGNGAGASWTGGISNWTGIPAAPTRPRTHQPRTAPAKAHHHRHHPKPNV